MKKRTIWILVILAVVLVGGYFGFTRWRAAQQAANALPQTTAVQRGDLQAVVGATGTVHSAQSLDMAFGTAGTVAEVLVSVGDKVTAEQPLASLQTDTLEAQVASATISLQVAEDNLEQLKEPPTDAELLQAEANLESARASYETAKAKPEAWQITQIEATLATARQALDDAQAAYDADSWRPNISMLPQSKNLQAATDAYEKALDDYRIAMAGVSDAGIKSAAAQVAQAQDNYDKLLAGPTEEDLLSAQAQVDQASISLENAQRSLENATLTAPFGGTVTAVNIIAGETVSQNAVAISLSDLDNLDVEVSMAEVDIVRVREGQAVEVVLDAIPDETLSGEVSQVALVGTATQGVVNYPIVVALDPTTSTVKPGMTASLTILVDERTNVLQVPNRAVRSYGNNRGYYVEVLFEGQIIQVPVTIGLNNDSMTEIVSEGLREGDQVVVSAVTTSQTSFGQGAGTIGGGMGGFFIGR